MQSFVRLLRYSVGVGPAVFVLSLVSWRPLGEAAALAAVAVAAGWLLWGFTALADEYRRGAVFAAQVTAGAARVLIARRAERQAAVLPAEGPGGESEVDPELEQAPARWVVVNDRQGSHLMALPADDPASWRRRVLSFLALGHRVGSFRFRDMRGRAMGNGERVTWATWRAFTDALAGAGLFVKDRAQGARPRGTLAAVMEQVERGAL